MWRERKRDRERAIAHLSLSVFLSEDWNQAYESSDWFMIWVVLLELSARLMTLLRKVIARPHKY